MSCVSYVDVVRCIQFTVLKKWGAKNEYVCARIDTSTTRIHKYDGISISMQEITDTYTTKSQTRTHTHNQL